jgi:prophage regulatory protein
MTHPIKPKVYFIKDAEKIVGRNRLTLRRWWRKCHFPKPTLINNRLAWRADVIDQWINKNLFGAMDEEAKKQDV